MQLATLLAFFPFVTAFQPQLPPALQTHEKCLNDRSFSVANSKEIVDAMDAGSDDGYPFGRAKGLAEIQRYRGNVDYGFGRGGKDLGFPTANLPSSLFQNALEQVDTGVYFGWAALADVGFSYKAVVNVGYSPTFEGKENKEKIIEAHLILDEGEDMSDFYGVPMRLQLAGFLRDEQKFDSFSDLKAQIQADKEEARMTLDLSPYSDLKDDEFLRVEGWVGKGGGDSTASWEFVPMDDALEELQGSDESAIDAVVDVNAIDAVVED